MDNPETPDAADAASADAHEAAAIGEKPDLGRSRDALFDALTGSGGGSDTRAGSLRGGSVSGSDIDPDQEIIDDALAKEGLATAAPRPPASVDPSDVKNTGAEPGKDPDPHNSGPATG